MKIGLVCPYSINRGGGVKEITFALYKELSERGHEVYIITPRPSDYDDKECPDHILFVGQARDLNWPIYHTTVQISAALNERISQILTEHKFDVLHFQEPWVPVLGRQILNQSTCANVATFHAAMPDSILSQAFGKAVVPYTKTMLKNIDVLVATGNPAAEYIRSLTNKHVTIVPVGIDQETFTQPARYYENKKQKTILYIGRLENRKGAKYLLQAFSILQAKRPNTSLIIAGDGPDSDMLQSLSKKLKLHNVQFLGYISNEDKVKYLRTSDLYCAPALYGEGFGLVLLEAMASGCVTVAGDNPGYASIMEGLGSLSLINPRHRQEFAHRLELLLYETDLRKLWRKWATEQLPLYSYAHITDQYEEIYKQAIKQNVQSKRSSTTLVAKV